MTTRVSFEPKDPRIIVEDYWYSSGEEDESEEYNALETVVVDGKPRKRKTGTQALVEFLNTTSPEEFQKMTPKRTSSFFRRKVKNNASVEARQMASANKARQPPHIIHRKNYIEIIANPLKEAMKSSKALSSRSSLPHEITASRGNNAGHINNNSNNNNNDSSNNSNFNNSSKIKNSNHSGMILPLPYRGSVKHEPSLYSVQRSILPRHNHDETRQANSDADSIIEKALLQRLEQNQQNCTETPGEIMTNLLASEHIRALNILAEQEQEKDKNKERETTIVKKRTRHVQVQTLPLKEETTDKLNTAINVSASTSSIMDNESILKQLEIAEKGLKKERMIRQKLEAALMERTDQFEVLSGIAYLKLRELWEEKLHWENAYLDIKERSWRGHQNLDTEITTSSDEGLSLDESYIDETNMYLHYPQMR